jgi:uncharacterized protein (DUF1015 family)
MKKIIEDQLLSLGVKIPTIYLPNSTVDLTKWSVVACDQYTSEMEYWQQVETIVADTPSTLNLVLPEVYLESPEKSARISKINSTMKKYLDDGILAPSFTGFVLVRRTLSSGRVRTGLVVALDLEKYDYNLGSKTLIRATEGTVVSRIPPRLEIRQNAPLEFPHIMVLINDSTRSVIEKLSVNNDENKIYDFDLMQNGGHLQGWKITDESVIESIASDLGKLISPDGLLFAMGDGNHSLATAKALWEQTKVTLSEAEQLDHPSRFALVELVNIHDEGLEFEPIHRVVFNVDTAELMAFLGSDAGSNIVQVVVDGQTTSLSLAENSQNLVVGNLQKSLDKFILTHLEVKIDYVHGADTVIKLSHDKNTVGFLLEGMKKEDLFPTVEKDGALPRKTFSMGEAHEKRFYLEGRKIIN